MSELEAAQAALHSLDQFPVVQAAVAITILGTAMIVWFRGERGSKDHLEPSGGISLFFDGPLKATLDTLQGIYRRLGEMKNDNADAARELRRDLEKEHTMLRDILEYVRSGASTTRRNRRRR